MKKQRSHFVCIPIFIFIAACSGNKQEPGTPNVSGKDLTKETFSISTLLPESKVVPDSMIMALNAQHHQLKVLERRAVSGPVVKNDLKYFADHAVTLDRLPVINPGPGEFVHVMEGQRHGYNNLTIGITETFPGGAPPMHSHEGEESHVLLEGDILYALGDTMFTIKAPYMVNIPAGVPHAFKNVGSKTVNMVVIFPTNVWKYDVLEFFPFSDSGEYISRFKKFKNSLAKK